MQILLSLVDKKILKSEYQLSDNTVLMKGKRTSYIKQKNTMDKHLEKIILLFNSPNPVLYLPILQLQSR
jgi:hypothetical protein